MVHRREVRDEEDLHGSGVAGVLSDPGECFVGPVGLFGGEFALNIGPRFGLAIDAGFGERLQKTGG